MRERPILFSAPMVRGLLEDRKTQTRRALKASQRYDALLPSEKHPEEWVPWIGGEPHHSLFCPYGVPGDLLWVRERAWFDRQEIAGLGMRCFFEGGHVRFANGSTGHGPGHPDTYTAEMFALNTSLKQRPSIHMPRWASRITLRITDVRVERLQDISEADAEAEGAPRGGFDEDGRFYENPTGPDRGTHRAGFAGVWDHINGPGSWDENPWVWALSFEGVR